MVSIAYGGLDVHKESISACIICRDTGELFEEELPNDQTRLLKAVKRWSKLGELHLCYEASGVGFVVKRWLDDVGVNCDVIAPSRIPKASGDRVKTDKRDARQLALLHAAGMLTTVRVPTRDEEAVRSLVRLRGDITQEIVATKNRAIKYLRTLGHVYQGGENWTLKHREWIKKLELEAIEKKVVGSYLKELDEANERRGEVDRDIEQIAQSEPYREKVDRLRCLKGIDVYSAMVLLSEIGDVSRFDSAPELMSYFGLVPSERSSGKRRQSGPITKAGSSDARWILVQAAWNQTRNENAPERVVKHWKNQPEEVVRIAKKGHRRLYHKFWKIAVRKDRNTAATAVAREMAGFVWAILTVQAA